MAKIALIGATGFVGAAVLKEAVSRGHTVTALVRNTDKVEKLDNVTAVKTDVFDTDALAKQLAGHDIVISAFNPGWTDANIRENHIKGSRSINEAAKRLALSVSSQSAVQAALLSMAISWWIHPNFRPSGKKAHLAHVRHCTNCVMKRPRLDVRFACDHSSAGRTHRKISSWC